jgi:hypothetical protein
MSLNFDLADELAAGLGDVGAAWRFIRRFAERYATPVRAGDGYAENELRAAEDRLGHALPTALRQAYALIGKRDDLTSVQNHLLAPGDLWIDETGQVLVFRVENQHVAEWGVPLAAADDPDPPVVFRLPSNNAPPWRPFLDRLSVAWVEMVLWEWMLASDDLTDIDNRGLDQAAVRTLETRFRQLPMPAYPLWPEPDGPAVRWFLSDGALLRDDGQAWLWVRATSTEGLATVRRALPGEWLMIAD